MCIDFYGISRASGAPDRFIYHTVEGQTPYTPDPISILKNPPHPQLARRFVEFVLSRRGQALLCLPEGTPDGPVDATLYRQPIRKDVYKQYAGKMLPQLVDPYQAGRQMAYDVKARDTRFTVLKFLIRSAAVDNFQQLRQARKTVMADPSKYDRFVKLPDNVADMDKIAELEPALKDPTRREKITADWADYFRKTFEQISE